MTGQKAAACRLVRSQGARLFRAAQDVRDLRWCDAEAATQPVLV